jgi:hypothetical protein
MNITDFSGFFYYQDMEIISTYRTVLDLKENNFMARYLELDK